MSTLTDVADTVVARLNVAPSLGFTATRKYLPTTELAALDTLLVAVVPVGEVVEMATRNNEWFDCQVRVAVHQKVDPSDVSAIDVLTDLSESVIDRLRVSASPYVRPRLIEHDVVFEGEHLDQMRLFSGRITLTYRKQR